MIAALLFDDFNITGTITWDSALTLTPSFGGIKLSRFHQDNIMAANALALVSPG